MLIKVVVVVVWRAFQRQIIQGCLCGFKYLYDNT
jgi:hypothetical protein